jgi:hypothetical protein
MQTSRKLTRTFLALAAMLLLTAVGRAADPGAIYPASSEVSDQKAGSLLIYNIYTSSSTSPTTQNTQLNITNTSSTSPIAVHVFFVDGATCSIADRFLCLTPNQTSTALASDQDPGTTGYVVAIAVDFNGHPALFNFLIGDLYVKFQSGHFANLGAEAFAKLGTANVISTDGSQGAIFFDGLALPGSYNRVPRVLALDNIPARADGNDTLLIVNRIGGNLGIGAATLGNLFGILYDDGEGAHSFTFSGSCQLRSSLSNNFPRLAPRFELIIPAGSTGWMKFWSPSDIGILGASINFNPNAVQAAGAFNSGHNLHKLTLTASATYTFPIFEPSC